ncbi:hypothetical protein, partial [Roseibium sp.]|uniref:hypothetical protein n=1 Tax=Roseibium sp. TaxID=1936156 RepID=UPI003D0C7188
SIVAPRINEPSKMRLFFVQGTGEVKNPQTPDRKGNRSRNASRACMVLTRTTVLLGATWLCH